jgi:hypothetical protein
VVSTADISQPTPSGDCCAVAEEIVEWVSARHRPCSLATFASPEGVRTFLAVVDKLELLRELSKDGELIAGPEPSMLPL